MATDIKTIADKAKEIAGLKEPGHLYALKFEIDDSPKYLGLANILKLEEKRWNFKSDDNKITAVFYNNEKVNYLIIDTFKKQMTIGSYTKNGE